MYALVYRAFIDHIEAVLLVMRKTLGRHKFLFPLNQESQIAADILGSTVPSSDEEDDESEAEIPARDSNRSSDLNDTKESDSYEDDDNDNDDDEG